VEFLRSCYRSKWRLHRDADILTAGRYYFVPPGTPHYPGLHNLGSRNWTTDEREPVPALGEWDGPQFWYNGVTPKPLPLPVLVGDADCVRFGERLPDEPAEIVPDNTCNAYPAACYGIAQAERAAYDISCCETQLAFAEVVNAIYEDIDYGRQFLEDYLGDGFTYATATNGPVLPPGSIIAVGSKVFVFLAGSTNFFQIALQILYAGFGPIDMGGLSTNPAWYATALAIETRMTAAGAGAQTEFYFVGHSFGGAVAQVLAARMRQNRPAVLLNVVTFGSPCAGDSRLVALLEGARTRHYCIPEDPVPGMPPRTFTLFSFFPILSLPLQIQWALIAPPKSRVLLGPNGEQVDSDDEFLPFSITDAVANLIATGAPVDFAEVHAIARYVARMRLSWAPPGPPFVFRNPLAIDWLNVTIKYLGVTYNFSGTITASFSLILYDGVQVPPPVGFDGLSVSITPVQAINAQGNPFGPPVGCSVLFSVAVSPTINFMVRFLMEPYAYWAPGKELWHGPPEIWFGFPVDPPDLWTPIFNAISFDSLNIEPV